MYFRRLRDMREDADLKQADIAKYLGIQQTVYSRYERGYQTIPLEHLIIPCLTPENELTSTPVCAMMEVDRPSSDGYKLHQSIGGYP